MAVVGWGLLAAALAGCGRPEPPDERPSRLLEVIVPEGCAVAPTAPRRLAGAYLRETEGPGLFELLVLRGLEGTNALPPTLRMDDAPVRPRPVGVVGSLVNTRPATAEPLARLQEGGGARGYVLRYGGAGLSYAGIAVVGEAPGGAEVPSAGSLRMEGPAELVLRDADGAEVAVAGRAEAVLGFGTGSMGLRLTDLVAGDGRALPFATLDWSGLGLCGLRVVSTGRGSLRAAGPEGRLVTPFGPQGAPGAARSTLDATLIAGADRGAPPAGLGGVLLIEGDALSLRGGFALRVRN
ncbi:MAG: hypothetical protein ACXIUV_15060 [Alkalilacustris sp.]